jgi:IS1 family transposase
VVIRLGIILVFLIVFFFMFRWFYRNVVTPALHDRHQKSVQEIEKENSELDEALARMHTEKSTFAKEKEK